MKKESIVMITRNAGKSLTLVMCLPSITIRIKLDFDSYSRWLADLRNTYFVFESHLWNLSVYIGVNILVESIDKT